MGGPDEAAGISGKVAGVAPVPRGDPEPGRLTSMEWLPELPNRAPSVGVC